MSGSLVARASVRATQADGRVELVLDDGPACPGCRCARLIGAERRAVQWPLEQGEAPAAGSIVELSASARDVLRASLWLHGLPWAALLVGAALGAVVVPGDVGSGCGAALGFATGWALLRRRLRGCALPHLAMTTRR